MKISCPKSDMFSLQLTELAGGAGLIVNSVDIFQTSFKHRLTFSTNNRIREVLAPELSDFVETVLGQVDVTERVHSQPGRIVELPGLTLGRLRVLIHETSQNTRQIVLRFAYFIGGVQAAFAIDTRIAMPTVSHREAIAVSALIDICTPALNIISNREHFAGRWPGSQTRMQMELDGIDEVENELSFYLHLLKRYIVSVNPGQTSPEPVAAFPRDTRVYDYEAQRTALGASGAAQA